MFNPDFEKLISEIIEDYEKEINFSKDDVYKKEEAIYRFCRTLEILHPYQDGNCRVFSMLLHNALRSHNGLEPIVQLNPNLMDNLTFVEFQDAYMKLNKFMELQSNKDEFIKWQNKIAKYYISNDEDYNKNIIFDAGGDYKHFEEPVICESVYESEDETLNEDLINSNIDDFEPKTKLKYSRSQSYSYPKLPYKDLAIELNDQQSLSFNNSK
ncbi:MAG: hypothetical protein EP298_01765 [Gammaproteobacteria bacterium]|nr:MAG: hypothetical protein EP298_01765 [Gammaproteobacteria bacterium]UTW41367.1 hypothetical protein KFE69_07535 [bacterium SCSIO 12844]